MKGRALRGVRRSLFSPASLAAWAWFTTLACSEAGSTRAPFSYAGASGVEITGGASTATGGTTSSGGASLVTGGTGTGGAGPSAGSSTGGSIVGLGATGGMPTLATGGTRTLATGGSSGGSVSQAGAAPVAGGSGGAAPAGTFKQVAALLGKSCATMQSCHGTGSAQTAFTGGNLYNTLLSKRAIAYCDDAPLVVPSNPTGSALYNVIGGHCGNFVMPPSTSCKTVYCPTEEDWHMIGSWIAKGAPND